MSRKDMYMDKDGILRRPKNPRDDGRRKPVEEARRVFRCAAPRGRDEEEAPEDGAPAQKAEATVVICSAWVEAWLLFVRADGARPGPINNRPLLRVAKDGTTLERHPRARKADARSQGDYREVSKDEWDAFSSLYPGSGPLITVGEGGAWDVRPDRTRDSDASEAGLGPEAGATPAAPIEDALSLPPAAPPGE